MLCPDSCRGCGAQGELLCERCKKYIFEHYRNVGKNYDENVFEKVFGVGYRDEIIGELVEEYKYYSLRGMARVLAEILDNTVLREIGAIVDGKSKPVVVPLPTTRKHIRARGFDHVELILKKSDEVQERFETKRLLLRAKDSVQVGASEKMRLKQAKDAYKFNPRYLNNGVIIDEFKDRPVVLFDDIWTTGASLTEGAKILCNVGVSRVYGIVLAVNRRGRKPILRRGNFDDI